jgi:6-pyruvoyltetrahydropterin/6-carboxytetrahydropterin synthase
MREKIIKKDRILKLKTSFNFDSAHRLIGYDGVCQNVHGHIWTVELEVIGKVSQLDKVGMLWDFTNVKHLKNYFDHKIILKNCKENIKLINLLIEENNEICLIKGNPTAENLCLEILNTLENLNSKLKYIVRVFESPKSSCEVSSYE